MSILKIRTKGTSTYYVDNEGKKFFRTKGTPVGTIDTPSDNQWTNYLNEPKIVVGSGILFVIDEENPEYTWQKTTKVTDITEISAEDIPAF